MTGAVAPDAPSMAVAVTSRSKLPKKSGGGVIERPSRSPGVTLASSSVLGEASVPLGSKVMPPEGRLMVALSGMPAIVTDSVSEPSRSVSAASISSAMALSSSPLVVPVSWLPAVSGSRSSVGVEAEVSG